MRTRSRNPFTSVTTAGLLLPVDLLTRIVEGDPDLKGLSPTDYHYGRLQAKKTIEIEGKEYPISHGWENHVPIHLLSARYPLDRRTPGVSGAASPGSESQV